MGYILDRIKDHIKAAADADTDYNQIGYGDPNGGKIFVDALGWFERGRSWVADRTANLKKGALDFIVESIAAEFEQGPQAFATVDVGASEVDPVILHSSDVASVTKFESSLVPPPGIADYLTVTLSQSYKDANYMVFAYAYNTIAIPLINNMSANQFQIQFEANNGSSIDLNGMTIGIMTKGVLV